MLDTSFGDQFNRCQTLADFEKLYPPRNLNPGAEITRIAPSPTGMPHIGTALQSVINRALADRTTGKFLLRIEDTDRTRMISGATEEIISGLAWLGMFPDEGPAELGGDYGPYVQSERLHLYRVAAEYLLSSGNAYKCFCTSERLENLRHQQMKNGVNPRYDGCCKSLSDQELQSKIDQQLPYVIRMKLPPGETITFEDLVRGYISFESQALDESVVFKSDGYPTYHLAAMVDDHFMRVTTVVRGEEWISSTPKHLLLYRYFGWEPPKFLHTVLLRDAQKRKLSKRSGDTSIGWFRKQGILPNAFRNFLTRIMWSHPEEKDIYDFAEFKKLMQVKDLPKTGPVVDMALLTFINNKYFSEASTEDRFNKILQYLDYLCQQNAALQIQLDMSKPEDLQEIPLAEISKFRACVMENPEYTKSVFDLEPGRVRRLADVFESYSYFFKSFYQVPPKALIEKTSTRVDLIKPLLEELLALHQTLTEHSSWDQSMRAISRKFEMKDKVSFMLLRVAVTACDKTPPLFEILQILGLEEVQRRINLVLQTLS